MKPLMRFLLEMGPLVIFFLSNKGWGLMPATAFFMAALVLAVGISWMMERKLPVMPFVGGVFVIVFGSLTLWLHDETFIKIKPTLVNGFLAAVLLAGWAFGKNFLRLAMGHTLALTDDGWRRLTWRFSLLFLGLAFLNEAAWRTLSTDAWVTFKVFGIMPLTLIFGLFQMPLILKHRQELT